MRGPGQWGRTTALVVTLGVLLAGCGAAPTPGTGSSASEPTPSAAAVSVPPDGVLLRSLGLANGPVEAFSLPRTTVVTSVVDQPNGVSLVISQPGGAEVYGYLVRALPAGGFAVTDQVAAAGTLTFEGHGWRGSFTSGARVSAVLLRPS